MGDPLPDSGSPAPRRRPRSPGGQVLLLLPTLIYAALAELFGTDSYVPYRVTGLVLDVLAAGLFMEFARRRTGYAIALGGAILLLFFGAAADVVAIPGRVPTQVAMCAGLGILLALDRGDRRGDVVACALCAVAVTSHPVGLAFVAACLAWILLDDPARRWRRSWVFLVPLALYALWYATLRDSIEAARPSFSDTVSFAWDAFVAVCGALIGVFHSPWTAQVDFLNPWSTAVAVAVIAVGVAVTVRTRRLSPALAALLVALAVNLIGPAIAPGGLNAFRQPATARYLYPGAIFTLLVAAELIRGRTLDARFRGGAIVAAALVFASAMYSNIAFGVDRTDALASGGDLLRSEFGALELARDGSGGRLPDDVPPPQESVKSLIFTGGPLGAPAYRIVRTAPAYFAITDKYGSPAWTRPQIERAPPELRQRADIVLATALGVEPQAEGTATGRRSGSCVRLDSEATVPPGRVRIEPAGGEPRALRIGRLAQEPSYVVEWPPARAASLRLPAAGLGGLPWRLRLTGGAEATACSHPSAGS